MASENERRACLFFMKLEESQLPKVYKIVESRPIEKWGFNDDREMIRMIKEEGIK